MPKDDPAVDRAVGISNRPRAFLTMQLENENPFRVVVELRPDLAPTLVDNFLRLCKGTKEGRGYKESKVLTVLSSISLLIFDNFYQIFRCSPNERIEGGDFEKNDGTGGHSAFNTRDFLAEQVVGKLSTRANSTFATFTFLVLDTSAFFCYSTEKLSPNQPWCQLA